MKSFLYNESLNRQYFFSFRSVTLSLTSKLSKQHLNNFLKPVITTDFKPQNILISSTFEKKKELSSTIFELIQATLLKQEWFWLNTEFVKFSLLLCWLREASLCFGRPFCFNFLTSYKTWHVKKLLTLQIGPLESIWNCNLL